MIYHVVEFRFISLSLISWRELKEFPCAFSFRIAESPRTLSSKNWNRTLTSHYPAAEWNLGRHPMWWSSDAGGNWNFATKCGLHQPLPVQWRCWSVALEWDNRSYHMMNMRARIWSFSEQRLYIAWIWFAFENGRVLRHHFDRWTLVRILIKKLRVKQNDDQICRALVDGRYIVPCEQILPCRVPVDQWVQGVAVARMWDINMGKLQYHLNLCPFFNNDQWLSIVEC